MKLVYKSPQIINDLIAFICHRKKWNKEANRGGCICAPVCVIILEILWSQNIKNKALSKQVNRIHVKITA